MGPDQRHAASTFITEPGFQLLAEPLLRRLVTQRAVVLQYDASVAGELRIQLYHLALERCHRDAPSLQQFQTERDQLVVPRRKTLSQARRQCILQQTVSPMKDLPLPLERRQVRR